MAKAGIPSRKLFISDLSCYAPYIDLTSHSLVDEWHPQTSRLPRLLKYVWLQGTVVQIDNADTFLLDDGTGAALVTGCCKLPKLFTKPEIDGYFLVIGKLMAIKNVPVVKVFKLQDLRGKEMLKKIWPLEVMDMRLHEAQEVTSKPDRKQKVKV
ncbi:recQ-mediated genome instability protein 2-like [Liolophura sinensis]|uniref:recQ-mediated genome instability protein 2-like n=1 Tax=Liolophura sinensis TaxID=3198878 RepID=UPI0031597A77